MLRILALLLIVLLGGCSDEWERNRVREEASRFVLALGYTEATITDFYRSVRTSYRGIFYPHQQGVFSCPSTPLPGLEAIWIAAFRNPDRHMGFVCFDRFARAHAFVVVYRQ